MKIAITYVDAATNVLCTLSPMRTGPMLPVIKGWVYDWSDESNWPVECLNGVYQTAPKIYGSCDDDADLNIDGVLGVIADNEYTALKTQEHEKRKPYASWVGHIETMTWEAPIPYPTDGKFYRWDEPTISWVEVVA